MQEKSNLEQQKKDLQMTLSKLTHEIRNPIALIQSELQMIASAHPEITDFDGWYHVMENLEYIRNLLNELSQYNNAEHLTLIQTDMSAFLNSVTRSFKPALDYLGISLITDIPENLPLLFLDQVKMRQAFLNLLRNAQESIQHSHGIITVSAVSSDNHISIQISDNECGMTKCQLKNIFTPFTTYKPEGTGLGLSVTRQIIQAHKGSLQVHSIPEKGSTFQILLRG